MYYLNINTIGAFVFLLVVFALWREGPKFQAVEKNLSSLPEFSKLIIYGMLGVLLGLNLILSDRTDWPWLNLLLWIPGGFNLIIHEAGHGLMIFFPRPLLVAGGTLLEVGLPLGLSLFLFQRGYQHIASLCLFWLSLSLKSVADYSADARAQKLNLVGGGGHDWEYMLSGMGLLEYDQWIGTFFLIMAVLAYLLALSLAPIFHRRKGDSL